jgi:hypothetical protein
MRLKCYGLMQQYYNSESVVVKEYLNQNVGITVNPCQINSHTAVLTLCSITSCDHCLFTHKKNFDDGLLGCNAIWTCRHTSALEEHTAFIFSPKDGSSWYLPTSPHGVATQKTKWDLRFSRR